MIGRDGEAAHHLLLVCYSQMGAGGTEAVAADCGALKSTFSVLQDGRERPLFVYGRTWYVVVHGI